jgi:Alpha 1,4-glycosyltransferase conserved region/Glycosyltransferase sugar-binding region containing DXD motif
MADIIQSLWIGDSLGPLQLLSISSFLHFGHEYHLHCYQPIRNVPAGVVICDGNDTLPASSIFSYQYGPGKGSVAAFSNLFRYKLLLDQGGWWVDTDFVCVRPFAFPEPEVFASEAHKDSYQLTSAAMKLLPNHPVARACYEFAVRQDPATLQWGVIGPMLLTAVVRQSPWEGHHRQPVVFCPIPWWRWEWLADADPGPGSSFITTETYAVHLWHEMWRRHERDRQATFPATSLIGQWCRYFDCGVE